ncbi:urease accessory protein UreE [Clostridium sp. 19966]|uniref:urease accessory protein UreE n=1 Tax=Clostridium sp. 19966 TaxID=2768166 RepID=UPI0028DEABA3|nr:urease accessory protein UreE [Clostridium sp. 19966]MDT8715655.1 urease accessory protein UreE [Clostridium sp. 19966]
MIIEEKIGNEKEYDLKGKEIDFIDIEWYEVNKKIFKTQSRNGKEVGIRFSEHKHLTQGDILYLDEKEALLVNIKESKAIAVEPKTMEEMGKLCFEIGNKHVPVFIHGSRVEVAYDEPLMKLLEQKGFEPKKVTTKLINGLESHHHHE